MPIHYVGKPGTFKGKPLFHILCNLKNFGINRVVIRNTYLRYPEPTYYRIIRAQPSMDAETAKGTVWMDYVFRGVKCGIGEFSNTDIKDWQLLSKEEELEMCKKPISTTPRVKVLPATMPFPPLLKEIVIRDMKARGLNVDKEPQLPMKYCDGQFSWHRAAKEEEKPDVEFTVHACPELYEETAKN